MNGLGSVTAKVHSEIAAIPPDDWDRCANPDPGSFNPFVSHAFLATLEKAGATGPRTGWVPCHITLEADGGRAFAAMPLYLKTHSRGEYVFDYAWADAYQRAGGRYYPKLQCAVPFTPVPGPRLLIAPGADRTMACHHLLAAASQLVREIGASSLHVTFASEVDWQAAGAQGLLLRTGQQFHWFNEGYTSFDDFLVTLASRKRKAMRRERAAAAASGLQIVSVCGDAITEAHWEAMYRFYIDTASRKWGQPYLNRDVFTMLGPALGDRCMIVLALDGTTPVAGALHMIGGDCLYGRYWGCLEYVPCLHFELCYYRAIDHAIEHKLNRVEAGAQGEHKLARGYLPVTTYSAHWFADERLAEGVGRFLTEERRAVEASNRALAAFAPYRQDVAGEQD